jgi:branched-chain amino acid transport system permease protein
MVMYAPGGVASLIMMNLRLAAFGKLRELWTAYLALAGTAFVMLAGAGAMIEMLYHLQLNTALGPELRFMGVALNAQQADSWFGAAMVLACGIALFELTRRRYVADWERIQEEIEKEIKRREALL